LYTIYYNITLIYVFKAFWTLNIAYNGILSLIYVNPKNACKYISNGLETVGSSNYIWRYLSKKINIIYFCQFDCYREGICTSYMPLCSDLDELPRKNFKALVLSCQIGNKTGQHFSVNMNRSHLPARPKHQGIYFKSFLLFYEQHRFSVLLDHF